MPGFLLTLNATLLCMHGGKGTPAQVSPFVKAMGQPVVMGAAPVVVAGCAFQMPCVSTALLPPTGTLFVKSLGQSLACASSAASPLPIQPVANAGQTVAQGM